MTKEEEKTEEQMPEYDDATKLLIEGKLRWEMCFHFGR